MLPRAALAACGLVAALLLAGCRGGVADGLVPVIPIGTQVGLSHVHGLGVNPADGDLYVATHFGLWRVGEDGDARRVGAHHLDLMGFTVVGPDRFIASGHPPLTDELPPHLGLIETDDAGETWRLVSLTGEADFHALRAAHGRVYGWSSVDGAFMVSDDQVNWEVRSTLPVFDFVVDPDDPDHVLAAAPAGGEFATGRSRDGGRSWVQESTPPLARLAWESADRLFAVGPDGAVWAAVDPGESWEQLGHVGGFPKAFLDAGDRLYVAVDGTLQVSADDGRTWRLLVAYH